jgi:hypothetical protein
MISQPMRDLIGQPRGEPLTGHTRPGRAMALGQVFAVALGEIDGEPVVVSGGL